MQKNIAGKTYDINKGHQKYKDLLFCGGFSKKEGF